MGRQRQQQCKSSLSRNDIVMQTNYNTDTPTMSKQDSWVHYKMMKCVIIAPFTLSLTQYVTNNEEQSRQQRHNDILLVKKMSRIAICNNNSAAVSVTSVLPKKVSMTCTLCMSKKEVCRMVFKSCQVLNLVLHPPRSVSLIWHAVCQSLLLLCCLLDNNCCHCCCVRQCSSYRKENFVVGRLFY